ncbi:MAG: PIF1 family DEAD/DEAH box helicase [Dehalococcoidia bacterium]|jgi:ATP-dependent DNA helicase PIF1|nr:PIF1 family DEAD/DEAH box helicase [Dehalococcoidia bacterium]
MKRRDLTADQYHVYELAVECSKSVFYTGQAGTGKSYLLRAIYAGLVHRHGRNRLLVALTASTGRAAVEIGGRTLHSWAGIELGDGSAERLVGRVRANSAAALRWRACETLVIDEISMITGALIDKLDVIGRALRNSVLPFGGIQVVATGDLLQLEPVRTEDGYCFQASAWPQLFGGLQLMLTTPHRQAGDPAYRYALDQLRVGTLLETSRDLFASRVSNMTVAGPPDEIRLVPYIARARAINAGEYAKLPVGEPEYVYDVSTGRGTGTAAQRTRLLETCPVEALVRLKVGTRVLLVANVDTDSGLCNGAAGLVIGFEHGSRRGHDGNTASEPLPVVQFLRTVYTVERHMWSLKDGADRVLASIQQIPLILGWSLTIHKAQGMTLDTVAAEISGCFARGQTYVALSRTRTLAGLRIDAVPDVEKCVPDPVVVRFCAEHISPSVPDAATEAKFSAICGEEGVRN